MAKNESKIIYLDTHTLIWGVQSACTPGQEQMKEKALNFIKTSLIENASFMISSVVLSEFLAGIPEENHNTFINTLSKNFIIVPFDSASALETAKLSQKHFGSLKKEYGSRNALKDDIKILATALVYKPTDVLVNDKQFLNLAKQYFFNTAYELPEIPPEQQELFTS